MTTPQEIEEARRRWRLGHRLTQAGDLRGAAAAFVKAAMILDEEGQVALHAAHALERIGDKNGATAWAIRAAERFARKGQEAQALAALRVHARLGGKEARAAERKVLMLLRGSDANDEETTARRAAHLLDAGGWIAAIGEKLGEKLIANVEEMVLVTGEYLVHEGERANALFFVVEGKLVARVRRGERAITLGTILPGDAIGEIAYFHDRRRSADVIALEPSRLLKLPFAVVDRLAQADAGFAERLEQRYRARLLTRLVAVAPLLGNLSLADRERIVQALEPVRVRAGETLIAEGQPDRDLYLVRSGLFAITHTAGGRQRWIKDVGPGGLVGDAAAITGRRTATAQAKEDAVVYRLPEQFWLRLVEERAHLREALRQRCREQLAETRATMQREQAELHRLLSVRLEKTDPQA